MIIRDPNLLRSLFALNGWQQKDVAYKLHMSQNSVVRMLKKYPVQRRTANQIADLVDKPVEELFEVAPKEHAVVVQ